MAEGEKKIADACWMMKMPKIKKPKWKHIKGFF